jgi:hypothetical protein
MSNEQLQQLLSEITINHPLQYRDGIAFLHENDCIRLAEAIREQDRG